MANFVVGVEATPGSGGGATGVVDTSGADLLVVGVSGANLDQTPTDSKSNTWNALTIRSGASIDVQMWYSIPASVGTGHTFTYSDTSSFPWIGMLAFSGVNASQTVLENGVDFAGQTTIQPGSVTPTANGEVLVAILGHDGPSSAWSINNNFIFQIGSVFSDSVNYGGGMSYLIQPEAASINPAWSWTSSASGANAIASFDPILPNTLKISSTGKQILVTPGDPSDRNYGEIS